MGGWMSSLQLDRRTDGQMDSHVVTLPSSWAKRVPIYQKEKEKMKSLSLQYNK